MKQIYAVWFITSVFLTFIINVRSALMAELVSREQYTNGNALVLSLLNVAKLLGPLLGGFYMTLVGMHAVRDRITQFEIRSSAYE
jgi:MFS family permease